MINKQAIRYYCIGFILLILVLNIPEVQVLVEERLKVAQPKALSALKFAYDDISVAVVPLVGKIIGKPKLLINGAITQVDTSDDMSLSHGQSLTADQIEQILSEAKSPAIGTGQYWIDAGTKRNIDAAYMLAIFYYESGFATNKAWAGYKEGGTHTYNIGNMICSGYSKCYGAFRDYSEWDNPWWAGIEDNTRLLAEYRDNNNIKTFGAAITKWAPPSENNTKAYIEGAEAMIRAWRNTNKIIVNEDNTVIQALQSSGNKIPFGDAQALSAPITENTNDGFGLNVRMALDANNNALRNITIKDGEQWSFNETIGNPDNLKLVTVSNVYGGGWCDLACRYIQVFKGLGLQLTHGTDINANDIVFLQHGGISLNNCSFDESPFIWSSGQKGFGNGMQDLIINNRTGKTIKIAVVDNEDKTATIVGKLE